MNKCSCHYEVWEVNPITGLNERVTRDDECECRLYRIMNDAATLAKQSRAFGHLTITNIHGNSVATIERIAQAQNLQVYYSDVTTTRRICWIEYAPGVVVYGDN
jgi:hypothetical protein